MIRATYSTHVIVGQHYIVSIPSVVGMIVVVWCSSEVVDCVVEDDAVDISDIVVCGLPATQTEST